MLFVCLFLFASCNKKAIDSDSEFEEATYSIEVTGKWASPDFTVPAGVHFTNFAGMLHNAQAELWAAGKFATKGVENVAEVGNTAVILLEIDSAIRRKNALSLILFSPPGPTQEGQPSAQGHSLTSSSARAINSLWISNSFWLKPIPAGMASYKTMVGCPKVWFSTGSM